MPILIAFSTAHGERRCDAKCYDAKDKICDCVCGGLNHGVGIVKAVENARSIAYSILSKEGGEREILYQLPLPSTDPQEEDNHA